MWFLGICLGSFFVSVGIDVIGTLKVNKAAADEGFKINNFKILKTAENMNKNTFNLAFLLLIIPILNIFLSLKRNSEIILNPGERLDQYYIMGALEEMSDYEKEEYSKKPTGLNALLVKSLYEVKLQNAIKFKVNNSTGKYEIYIDYDENENIRILKTVGTISSLDKKEQMKKILEALESISTTSVENIKVQVGEENLCEENERQRIIELLKAKKQELITQEEALDEETTSENKLTKNQKRRK